MKFLIFTLVATFLISVQCLADLRAYNFTPCISWMPSQSGGFVCAGMSSTVRVAEAESFAAAVRDQNARITALEKKIAELELECPRP